MSFLVSINRIGPATCAIRLSRAAVMFSRPAICGALFVLATTSLGAEALTLTAAQSRKAHGAAGNFDIPIDTTQNVGGALTVEPRVIGAGHQIVFQFDAPITAPGSAVATDENDAPIGAATTAAAGNEVMVTLTGVPDNKRVTVSLVNVNGAISPPTVSLGFMVGDFNNTRSVNSSDISAVKARSGQNTTSSNFLFDLNLSGAINSSDISAVKARSGLTLPPAGTASAQIAAARAAADGAVALPIANALVTYVKPLIGADPAGFFVQSQLPGPALFIAVDPATLTPLPVAGDRVSFTITNMATVASRRQATAVSAYARLSTGNAIGGLVQDASNVADLASNVAAFESELIRVTGTIAGPFQTADSGFVAAPFNTVGVSGSLQLRVTSALVSTLNLAEGCQVTANQVPMWRSNAIAQISGWVAADISSVSCGPTFALTVSKTGSGTGTVTSSPPGINCGPDCTESYPSPSLVTLTAAADSGSAFGGWSGGCSGTGACTVTMNAANAVVASFTGGLSLAVDPNPLRLTAVTDTGRTATQTIPVTGGSITVTGADGTVYTLDVPADALLAPMQISLTPTLSLDTPDLAKDAAYGVELGPVGATFHNFVTLTIAPPAGAFVPIARQLPIGWSGTQNVVSLAAIDPGAAIVKLKLLHFSGYALLLATTGTNATLEPVRHRLGGDAEARLQSLAAERLTQERQRQLLGNSEGTLVLDDLFRQYDEQVVQPRIAAAGTSCAAGRLALQTVLGFERQKQLLGVATGSFGDTILPVLAAATAACTREEYALCRDNHIITRILPYYLGVSRQVQLLGIAVPPGPAWLQDAEAAVGKCLNFELQINSRLNYSDGVDVTAHTVTESVESRVKLAFNIGTALFGGGYIASSLAGPDPLISLSYDVNYPHACAQVSGVQRIGAGMMGALGYTPEEGGIAQQAMVRDFLFTPAVVPNGAGSGYTLTRYSLVSSRCESPSFTSRENENWVNNGASTWADAFLDPVFGLAIRNWTIVASDIMATKDFTTQTSSGSQRAVVTTNLILFHKPAP